MEKCSDCGRELETTEALMRHRDAKHAAKKSERTMKIKGKHVFLVLAIAIAAAGAYFAYDSATGTGKFDEFAKCLTEKDAVFYGAFWCPHCADQKEMFGKSMKYINYLECSTPQRGQTQTCIDAKIESYPTWEFADGSRLPGVVTFQQLSDKTGCQPAEA